MKMFLFKQQQQLNISNTPHILDHIPPYHILFVVNSNYAAAQLKRLCRTIYLWKLELSLPKVFENFQAKNSITFALSISKHFISQTEKLDN